MASAVPPASFLERHEFLIHRLHSLSGLLPVGAFMCLHLLTNASVLGGAGIFQDNVDRIHVLGPALTVIEWLFIFLPIIFHAVVGVAIIRSGLPNTSSYPYPKNFRYTLQRVTAWIALFFIFWHVFHMHGWIHHPTWLERVARPAMGAQFEPERASSTLGLAMVPLWVKLLYGTGVLSCVYHLANGLWTMGITWGVWTSPAAQRRADYLCGGFGVALAFVGLGALFGASTVNVDAARAMEQARIQAREELAQREAELLEQVAKEPVAETSDAPAPDAAKLGGGR
jgi:succinate dehydrogenase / fumarate reductase, cytochrome b subunit